ncbi:unnamed protein product, partial [Staurois parvus]
MDFYKFPGRKNIQNAERGQDRALGTKCMGICKIVLKKMTFFLKFSNFSPPAAPVRPDVTGTGTQEPDAGISRRRWPGTLQGTH